MQSLNQTSHYLPLKLSFGLLGVLLLALFCPLVPEATHAEEALTHDVGSTVTADINSAVSVALQSHIDIDVHPEGKNTFSSATAKMTVTTNSVDGYSIYVYTNETNANLINPEDYYARITPIESETGVTATTFATNTWGYNLSENGITDDAVFRAVPLSTDEAARNAIHKTTTTAKADNYNLTFGVNVAPDLPAGQYSSNVAPDLPAGQYSSNVAPDLPAGQYSSNVVISVLVNPGQIRNLTQLTYMQDMTDVICQNTAPRASDSADIKYKYMKNPVEKQLIDIRDGKKYWVAKLADGNCWMTQNLALTLKDFNDSEGIKAVTEAGGKGAALTTSNTDIYKLWNSTAAIPPVDTFIDTPKGASNGKANSFDLGKYVLATPSTLMDCPNQSGVDPYSNCLGYGFVDVSDGSKWTDNFQASEGLWDDQTQLVSVAPNDPNDMSAGGSYDAHYLVGNFYLFDAATAGERSNTSYDEHTTASICPKGWQLPYSSEKAESLSTDKTYPNLLKNYGLATAYNTGSINGEGVDHEYYSTFTKPLYYARVGEVYSGALSDAGTAVAYRSAIVASAQDSRQLVIQGTTLFPTGYRRSGYSLWDGYSIRCVAK